MPKFVFGPSFSHVEQHILSKTFEDNCKQLGIADSKADVMLRRRDIGPEFHHGAMTQVDDDLFVMILNVNGFTLFEAISTLGHEAVHMWQYMRGDMVVDQEKDGATWKGEYFTQERMDADYHALPWEKEAFERQHGLFDSAMKTLNPIEGMMVFMTSEAIIERKIADAEKRRAEGKPITPDDINKFLATMRNKPKP